MCQCVATITPINQLVEKLAAAKSFMLGKCAICEMLFEMLFPNLLVARDGRRLEVFGHLGQVRFFPINNNARRTCG